MGSPDQSSFQCDRCGTRSPPQFAASSWNSQCLERPKYGSLSFEVPQATASRKLVSLYLVADLEVNFCTCLVPIQ